MSKRYAMVVDQKRCIGCNTCVIACKLENNMPADCSLNVVLTENSSVMDNPSGRKVMGKKCTMDDFNRVPGTPRNDFLTRSCQHCLDAPCVRECPTGASTQREDGIVVVDPFKCLGEDCQICMHECPYEFGAMRVLIKNPKFSQDFVLGSQDAIPSVNNTVKKCTFCAHRVDKGEMPYCIDICPAKARHFGDINDPESNVSRIMRRRAHKTIPAAIGKTGTEPFVYFLKA